MKLDTEQARVVAHRALDMVLDHFETLSHKPVTRNASPAELTSLREPVPERPHDPLELLEFLDAKVFSRIMHLDHPRFLAFVPGPGNIVGVIGDLLATGHNVFAGTWLEASAPAQVELVTLDWLRQLCGLPGSWSGVLTSGGSMANLTALAAACDRAAVDRSLATVYFSDQTHSSVLRALQVLGIHHGQRRVLPTAADFRLPVDAVREALAHDRESGFTPLAIVANAGTTNSGAVDPLDELGSLAHAEGVWLHVDAAYGGAAMLCPEGQRLLSGLHRAHSITLDPHKWLFQPYDVGCLLVRDATGLERTFRILPEYLQDVAGASDEVSFCNRGLELTRPFRALKLWMTFKVFGLHAISAAVQRGIDLAKLAESEIRRRPDWKIVTPAQLGIVTFRYEPRGHDESRCDAINHALFGALVQDGFAMMSTTSLHERIVCRFCTINPHTTDNDIIQTVAKLDALATQLVGCLSPF